MSQSLHLQTLDAVIGSDNKRRIVGFGTVKVKVSLHTTWRHMRQWRYSSTRS